MSGDNGFVNRSRAAELLEVCPRTISRYVDAGLLRRFGDGRYGVYSEEQALSLKEQIDARKDLGDDVKEIFAMEKCGISFSDIAAHLNLDSVVQLMKALDYYKTERQSYMRQFSLNGNDQESVLLSEEVLGRLKVTDLHIVGDLVNSGVLQTIPASRNGSVKYLIPLQSFLDYLGPYSGALFYRSQDIAKKLGIKISRVNKIRKRLDIGFKLKESDQGMLLFSEHEFGKIKAYQHKYEERLMQR